MAKTGNLDDVQIPGYELVSPLGRGTYGQVWKARAPGNTAVAIKFVDLHHSHGHQEWHAIQSIKRIRHANLMPIIAVWMIDEDGFIISDEAPQRRALDRLGPSAGINATLDIEYRPSLLAIAMPLGEKTLDQRRQECGDRAGIPPDELCAYLMDVARAIDYLNGPVHDVGNAVVGIQHGDIKPANMMLVGDSAQLCDYGVTRVLDATQPASALGSPAYMAPECIGEGTASRASDQYSLAVSYVELRTGSLPFDDDSLEGVIDAHLTGRLNLSRLTEDERAVIRRATSLDPKRRFASAVEMVRAIQRAWPGAKETNRAVATERVQLRSQRRRGVAGRVSQPNQRTVVRRTEREAPSSVEPPSVPEETAGNSSGPLDETARSRNSATGDHPSRAGRIHQRRRMTEAIKWYRRAAAQGNATAQKNLGDCYYRGWGVARDYGAARRWYQRAADQGHVSAQNNLGICYYRGHGVSRDTRSAMRWFLAAAQKNNAAAQNNLAHCYRFATTDGPPRRTSDLAT